MEKTKCILVTGGAGFIGSHVADKLVDAGQDVIVVDDFNDFYAPSFKEENIRHHEGKNNFHLYRGDITDADFLDKIFGEKKIDAIIHLAAMAGVRPSIDNPALCMKVNVLGTSNLLELAGRYGVRDFIFASSSSVYGNQKKTPFSEDDSADKQVSPYGVSKRSAELLIYAYHNLYGLNCACLRFFTVYGERGRPDMAPYLFTEALFKNREIKKFGDGETLRDYTYVSDITDGILKCLGRNFGCEILNLGSGKPVSLNSFLETLEKIAGVKAKIISLPDQAGDVRLTHADIRKAKRLLDWEPKTGIEEGLERFVKWYKETRL